MKLSKYNIFFKLNNEMYVFNTWKGSLIQLDDDLYGKIKTLAFESIALDKVDLLKKTGILTEIDDEFYAVLKENTDGLIRLKNFSICVCPTFKCNAKCPYCFEHGIECIDMDENTSNSVIDYIEEKGQGKKVHITWFGGEPLLGGNTISYICSKLNENNLVYHSSIVTNGYFIDRFINEFKLWHLNRMQVTLDGLEEKYNAIKGMGPNGFKKVISNIHLAVKENIHVTLRINFNSENYSDYKELIRFVHEEFANSVDLYFHDITGKDFLTPNEVIPNPMILIFEELIKYGYIHDMRGLKLKRMYSSCALNVKDYVNVCPDGSTNKCEHYLGKESEFSSGNINDDDFKSAKVFDNIQPDCSKCICFPLCGGGCLSNHILRKNAGCCRIKNIIEDVLKLYCKEVYNENSNS